MNTAGLLLKEFFISVMVSLILLVMTALFLFIFGGLTGNSMTFSLGSLLIYRVVAEGGTLSVEAGLGIFVVALVLGFLNLVVKHLVRRALA